MIPGLIIAVSGLLVIVVAFLGRDGRLPRNHFIGFRLPSTMRSDEAWGAAHRASWPYSAASGLVILVQGTRFLLDPDADPRTFLFLAGLLMPLVAGTVSAHRAGRNVDEARR